MGSKLKRVVLDGDALLFRMFVDGLYEDRIFIRDPTQPIENNCWMRVTNYRAFLGVSPDRIHLLHADGWKYFRVGDIVSRGGTDEQEILEIFAPGDIMTVKCIKAPHNGWCNVGDIEDNVTWNYTFVRSY